MNKLLLLSRIKGLMFVLKSTEYNTDLSSTKKVSELSFSSRLKIYVLMVSKLFFCNQQSKFSTVKENILNQGIFPQSRKFSTIKETFHNQGNFPQPRKFSPVKTFSANKDQKGSKKI